MIQLDKLTAEDKGRRVGYQLKPGDEIQEGTISSWNEHFIFVKFVNHINWGSIPTPPEKLKFL